MTTSKNIFGIFFLFLMTSCSYNSLRPEVVDRADAQKNADSGFCNSCIN